MTSSTKTEGLNSNIKRDGQLYATQVTARGSQSIPAVKGLASPITNSSRMTSSPTMRKTAPAPTPPAQDSGQNIIKTGNQHVIDRIYLPIFEGVLSVIMTWTITTLGNHFIT